MRGIAKTTVLVASAAAGMIASALLWAIPLAAVVSQQADPVRTIDVTLSRYAFTPERIEVGVGERVRLNVVSVDGAHGFQVKELGLNIRVPTRGKVESVELAPTRAGTFTITCSEYCGSGHSRMKARLIVTPGR